MTLSARLNRLSPVLTALERAILTVRSELADQQPDPELVRTMPSEQVTAFRRYLALYYVANAEMGTVALSLFWQANAQFRLSRLEGVLRETAEVAAIELGDQLEKERIRRRRRKRESVTMPQYLLDLAGDVADIQWQVAAGRWQEIRALEQLWFEICSEFDGEDVIRSDKRESLEDAKEILRSLFKEGRRRRWPEPAPDLIEAYRQHVEDVLRMWGLLEATR